MASTVPQQNPAHLRDLLRNELVLPVIHVLVSDSLVGGLLFVVYAKVHAGHVRHPCTLTRGSVLPPLLYNATSGEPCILAVTHLVFQKMSVDTQHLEIAFYDSKL